MKPLFEIRHLECAYEKGNVVLKVEDLKISQNKVIFFVGPSGVGKSTILETLGLMNNTIEHAEQIRYNDMDLRHAWHWSDTKISSFRNREFSFVFQQNNLMPNFSAHENILTAALFQGEKEQTARHKMRDILKALDLPLEDRPITRYSGGQQQRIAFARAILPHFNVVFGDEPTGNLDHNTADKLMQTLSNAVREHQAAAIIVSHDIDLAVKYADEIVMIHRVHPEGLDRSYGLIDSHSICTRTGENEWMHDEKTYPSTTMTQILKQHLA